MPTVQVREFGIESVVKIGVLLGLFTGTVTESILVPIAGVTPLGIIVGSMTVEVTTVRRNPRPVPWISFGGLRAARYNLLTQITRDPRNITEPAT